MSPTATHTQARPPSAPVCPHAQAGAAAQRDTREAADPRVIDAPADPSGEDDARLASSSDVRPDDELVLPLHRRVVTHRTVDASGAAELQLFAGDKEISFDEPDLFAFGETLARQSRFAARAAMSWGDGYPWARVQPLLAHLVEEGVLVHARDAGDAHEGAPVGRRPSPLPPAQAVMPATWSDCAAITARLAGRAVEIGHLETVVPVFRIAHVALDREGRQVGESNVFPQALRLEVPTVWRTCLYDGTRHRSDRPMNVSALKSMRTHWDRMMAMIAPIRACYLRRVPAARAGWTVAHVERLAVLVLAASTWPLVRPERPVANGALHPVLSSLFRVTDGVRMTMHQMLFVPLGEPTRAPDAPVSAAEVFAYAERNYSFHSEHGVCAGPRAMIEEFLAVLIEGARPHHADDGALDPELAEVVAALDDVADYAFRGLRVHAAAFSVWPLMAQAYEDLAGIAAEWHAQAPAVAGTVHDVLAGHLHTVRHASYLATAQWRADRARAYGDMFAACGRALGLPDGELRLPVASTAAAGPAVAPRLARILATRIADRFDAGGSVARTQCRRMAEVIAAFADGARRLLATSARAQDGINVQLDRTAPQRPVDARDLNVHLQMQGDRDRRVPFLPEVVEALFGLRLHIDASGFVLDGDPIAAD